MFGDVRYPLTSFHRDDPLIGNLDGRVCRISIKKLHRYPSREVAFGRIRTAFCQALGLVFARATLGPELGEARPSPPRPGISIDPCNNGNLTGRIIPWQPARPRLSLTITGSMQIPHKYAWRARSR